MWSAEPKYKAVLFDLLSALLDSGTLWNAVAGSAENGRRWRTTYLEITYRTGVYRPYEELVAEAASAVGLVPTLAGELAARYGELRPWPEVGEVLNALRQLPIHLAVVTNCSRALGATAVAQVGVPIDVVITAEDAGFYKPDPRPYRLALDRLSLPADRCLFVAGSAYDLVGTRGVGLSTFWHDRVGMSAPPDTAPTIAHESTLLTLVDAVARHVA